MAIRSQLTKPYRELVRPISLEGGLPGHVVEALMASLWSACAERRAPSSP